MSYHTLFVLVWGLAPAASEAPASLSLDEAVRLALANNEIAQIADQRLQRSLAQRQLAYGRILPSLGATGSLVHTPDGGGRLLASGEIVKQDTNALSARATLDATLVDLGALPDLMRAGRVVAAQRLSTEEEQRSLTFLVAEQFLLVLAAEQLLAASERRREVSRATVSDAQQRVAAGLGRPSDVTRAELALSGAELSVIESDRILDLARLGLLDLLGQSSELYEGAKLLPPDGSLLTSEPDPAELTRSASDQRTDLQQARIMAVAASDAVLENLLAFLPTFGASAVLTASEGSGNAGGRVDWSLAFVLSWRLFDGGRRLARDDLLEAEETIAELQIQQLERQIDRQVREAATQHQAALLASKQSEIQFTLAGKNLEETRARFQHGLATALERVDANAVAYEAEAERARRGLEVRLAELGVLRATGGWPVPRS